MNEAETTPIRTVITGARGRMSERLRAFAHSDLRFLVIDELGRRERESERDADLEKFGPVEVVIDFTNERGARHALALARAAHAALLVGTTGLSAGILDDMGDFARSRAVMIAPNTSIGAAILDHLAGATARRLGPRADIDIVERHHIHKRDAPSGTARRLADTIARATGAELPPGRVHSIRAGEIIGEHEVAFACPEEILKISHEVTNRDVFVRGALDIAAWISARPAGLHTIEDFLNLSPGPDAPADDDAHSSG